MANAFVIADQDSHLYVVRATDGAFLNSIADVIIGGNPIGLTGMAWDATTNTLWAVTKTADPFLPAHLITIDIATGAGTDIGALGLTGSKSCSDISCSPSGALYGWRAGANACLVSINKATGHGTQIGSSTEFGGAIAFIGSTLYYIPQGGAGNNLATLNLATGARTTVVALTGDGFFTGAAEYHDGVLYATAQGNPDWPQNINIATGVIVYPDYEYCGLDGGDTIDAIASVPIPPAPSPPSPPVNDNFDSGLISGSSGTEAGTLTAATPDWPTGDGNRHRPNVWYKWVAPSTGYFQFDIDEGGITSAVLYTGPDIDHLTLAQYSGQPLHAIEGQTYYIIVNGTDFTDFNLSWATSAYFPPISYGDGTFVYPEGWILDILDHDFSVLQSFRPETLHFIQRIRAVEDFDCDVSNSALNFDGSPVVGRDIPTDEDNFKAWKHMFQLRRMTLDSYPTGIKIMAGPIVGTNMALGRDSVKIFGKDWMEYLDRRQIPFDATHPTAFRFGPTLTSDIPPTNFSYQVSGRDIADIIDDILTVIFDRPHSLPFTWSLSTISIAINFALNLGDTSTALSIIDGLSEYWPGFDYRVSYDREFVMWSPFRYGDPDTTADDGEDGDNIAFKFGSSYDNPIVDLEYTNTGPQGTHIHATGAGTGASQLHKTLGASDIQEGYWRLDGSVDFGDQVKNASAMDNRTRKEFIFGAQEVHEINLTIDPQTVDDFWNVIKPGFAIWVREDLIQHEINSAQRIVSIELTKDQEDNELVVLGLNQIYNTSSHYGVSEG